MAFPRFNDYPGIDNPCKPDCPERKPGCCCERRNTYLAEIKAVKDKRVKQRNTDYAVTQSLKHGWYKAVNTERKHRK